MHAPLVSIIMPSFRSEKHIETSINSVISQSYQNWELIVADGGSHDRTRAIVLDLSRDDARVRLIINEKDDGPSHARAFAIRQCRGQYVAFLDADDIWLPSKLSEQINFMIETGAVFTYTKYSKISDDGSVMSEPLGARTGYTYRDALSSRGIGTLTVVVSRQCLTEEIISVNNGKHGEDYLWWCMILRNGAVARLVDKPLALYRLNSTGLSRSRFKHIAHVWKSYRDQLEVPLLKRIFCFITYPSDVIGRAASVRLRSIVASKIHQ